MSEIEIQTDEITLDEVETEAEKVEVQTDEIISRWRLILGKNSEQNLDFNNESYTQMEEALDYLYGREQGDDDGVGNTKERTGGQGSSQLTVVNWVEKIRELFPKEVSEKIEKHALEKYELVELLTDEKILKSMQPNKELLKNILTFKNLFDEDTLKLCKEIIRQVVDDMTKVLEVEIQKSFVGKRNKNQRSNYKIYRNFDVKYTIKKNLKNYDKDRQKLILDKPYFNSTVQQTQKYKVIMVIDQSASMLDCVINSAIIAGIFAKIPRLDLNLIIFDTEVVDLTEHADDPVETLLSVQLGGGTDIAKALNYSQQLIENPSKTILILLTDLFEGGSELQLLSTMKYIVEMGTKFITLTALDHESTPFFNKNMAEKAVSLGVEVASMTPEKLADYVAEVIK